MDLALDSLLWTAETNSPSLQMPEVLASCGSFGEHDRENTFRGLINSFLTRWYILIYLSCRLFLQSLAEVCQRWWNMLYILIVDLIGSFIQGYEAIWNIYLYLRSHFKPHFVGLGSESFLNPSFSLSIINRSVIFSWLIIIALLYDWIHLW